MPPLHNGSYWLTRFIILRAIGLVYAVAFLVAINQIIPLVGSNGLTPIQLFLDDVSAALGTRFTGFIRLPSIFWMSHSDSSLLLAAWFGFVVSCVVIAGYANAITMTILWFLYMSFVHVGQEWYGYGWEIQLCETGFLAIFLCPLFDMRPFPKRAPPIQIIFLFRWLIFRIMLGAGLIKLRGDEVWLNGTALRYHFETQPIPGPLSRWFHFLSPFVLTLGVWFNWLAELIAPLFVFWPRSGRHIAGIVMLLLQVFLIFSGNLSFLNWLTIIPALACFDDALLSRVLPRRLVNSAECAAENLAPSKRMAIAAYIVTALIAILSIQPVVNLLSPHQIMNTSFDPLHLVNTYGAFGSVNKERLNVVFEGTADREPNDAADWKPYLYRGLPVLLDRRPPQVAPNQLRLDWQMWFAAMASPEEYPWTRNLVWKLLHNDEGALSLFAGNPFPEHPPKFIRATLYQYSFAKPEQGQRLWWTRKRIGAWLPPMWVNDPHLRDILRSGRWLH